MKAREAAIFAGFSFMNTIIHKIPGCSDPFARIPKSLLNDPRISWKAKGILSYLCAKPDGWKVRVLDVVKHSTEGEHAVRSALKELRRFGYAKLTRLCEQGRVAEWAWSVSDSAVFSPDGDFPDVDFPDVENRHISKNRELTRTIDSKNECAPADSENPSPQDLRLATSIAPAGGPPPPESSPEAIWAGQMADWFREKQCAGMKLPRDWRSKWAAVFLALVKDGRTEDQIADVCEFVFADAFWQSKCLSPLKLRKRNPDGVQYFDVFVAAMQKAKPVVRPLVLF